MNLNAIVMNGGNKIAVLFLREKNFNANFTRNNLNENSLNVIKGIFVDSEGLFEYTSN